MVQHYVQEMVHYIITSLQLDTKSYELINRQGSFIYRAHFIPNSLCFT